MMEQCWLQTGWAERHNQPKHKLQLGFGLAEIWVSFGLASFILVILLNHYLVIKQNYRQMQVQLAEATELQMVTDLMREQIQQAGFTPCGQVSQLVSVDKRDGLRLWGIEVRSDDKTAVLIHRMSASFSLVLDVVNTNPLFIAHVSPMDERIVDHPVIIADCYHAEVQSGVSIVKTSLGQKVIFNQPMSFSYQPPIYIGEWVQTVFFMRKSFENNPSLFYKRERVDELTSLVHGLFARVSHYSQGTLVQIKLVLSDARNRELDALVRSR